MILTQIKFLTKLELCNLYGLNKIRFLKDKKAKKKAIIVPSICIVLLFLLFFYMGSFSYGFIWLGLEKEILTYLITVSSLLIFGFGILKSGNLIFYQEGYDMLCALPVTSVAIVVSRLIRMYVENLFIALAIVVPGIVVYGWYIGPNWFFYFLSILGLLFIPCLPMSCSILIGAFITGVSSKINCKSLVGACLSIFMVFAIMYGTLSISIIEEIELETVKEISSVVFELLKKVYPPACWMGIAVISGNLLQYLLYVGVSVGIFILVLYGISICFHQICQSLYSNLAKHNYKLKTGKQNSILVAQVKREFYHYFSSSVYITNTIIGPVMSCVFSGVFLVMDIESITEMLPFPVKINYIVPFILAGILCTMPTTAVSISMEGKNWWIVKSLPLSTKSILDAKILMNVLLLFPFYMLSEILLMIGLQPKGLELFWLIFIPIIFILFSCIYGITINLCFPVMDWEKEVSVVKQSASAMLGGMGSLVLTVLCVMGIGVVQKEYVINRLNIGICVMGILGVFILYRRNNRYFLNKC